MLILQSPLFFSLNTMKMYFLSQHGHVNTLNKTCFAFFFFPPLSVCVLHMFLCMLKILKVKKVKACTNFFLLSYRKHCSWNASSVAPPLILWLCDIELHHHVTHLHNLCLACKNWFSTTAVFLLAELAQACVSWPIRAGYSVGEGTLTRQEPKKNKISFTKSIS